MPSGFKWGVAATGSIAGQFTQAMMQVPDGEVVAVASRTLERAEVFAEQHSVRRAHGSYEELAQDPDVDVVYVASPHSRHEADTLLFLEAGKHVLCEKPFALNQRQVQRMGDEAQARDRFLMEAIWSRFLPSYQLLRELLAAGVIGKPLLVEAAFGFRMPFDPTHRLFDRALGGGALLDLGIYPLQLCSLVLGDPDQISAQGHLGESGVDEQVAAVLHHPGGALGVITAAITAPLSSTARIAGTDGWIDLPAVMHRPDHIVVTTPRGTERHDCPIDGVGLHYQVLEVHRCLRDGLRESPTMPLAESSALARSMDTIRDQLGFTYPVEEIASARLERD